MKEQRPLTVKALTKYIKLKFDVDKNLQDVYLKGELSNVKRHSRGHIYFTLKDDDAQINGAMFAMAAKHLTFEPKEGMQVLIRGNITVYESSGGYTLYAKQMQQDGIGNLFVAFTALKEKLAKEGLFDARHKKPIPIYPRAIGVITSPTGAAIRDILTTLKRRYPLAKVYIYPALVQGEEAKHSIVGCLKQANEMNVVDTLIVGRGGGSIEDLWAFNEEIVARAIFESVIPVISAVGHETDTTIADFVADFRAPTPTAAAEIAVPNLMDVKSSLSQFDVRLTQTISAILSAKKEQYLALKNHYMLKNPHVLYDQRLMRLTQNHEKLNTCMQTLILEKRQHVLEWQHQLQRHNPEFSIQQRRQRLTSQQDKLTDLMLQQLNQAKQSYFIRLTKLEMLNPLSVLKKGYTLAMDEHQTPIYNAKSLQVNQTMTLVFDDGEVLANVNKITLKDEVKDNATQKART